MAIFLPSSCSGLVISGLVTRNAPPDVDPPTMRSASPSDWAKPLMAGLGPMKLASMASAKSASIASGPALKVFEASSVTLSARASSKKPSFTPTIAGPWVMFGK